MGKSEKQDELTGALIGLVRATENNEHLITDELNRLLMEGLAATATERSFDSEMLTELIGRVKAAKERLVPDCFHCAAPCGRTNDYDMNLVWDAEPEVCSLKSLILLGVKGIAVPAYHAAVSGHMDEAVTQFLYKALFAIGMDWGKDELLPIAMETGQIYLRCRELPEVSCV